jgi:archaeal flagellar protein FlaJ
MQKWVYAMGFEDLREFMVKFALPIMGGTIAAYFVLLFFQVPWWLPYVFLLCGTGFVFAYPLVQFESKKVNVQENIHLFITYAGTISTLDVNRSQLFSHIAAQKQFGYISQTAEKTLYMAKKWNLGFAHTCRKMARFSPSRIFGDFLDRLAAVLDFGEDLQVFLSAEQEAVMQDYSTEYKQSLENIKTLQDVFISITIAMAFALAAALLLPLLMGISMMLVVQYGLMALIFVDLLLILLIKVFIPSDRLSHQLKIRDEGSARVRRWLLYMAPVSAGLLAITVWLNHFSFIVNVTIASFPLFWVGVMAIQEENVIFKRDKAYPAFIRAVGGTIYVRGGGVTSALGALQVHDFGVLQPMATGLYRRLRLGTEKTQSWMRFSAETGSNLIYYFTEIFRESIYLGGNGEKIGQIISTNFTKLLSLRKLRLQLASGMRGALYGGLVGFVTTIYMATAITDMLSGLFGGVIQEDAESQAAQLFNQILPEMAPLDMGVVNLYIGIMVIAHAAASAYIIKLIDGGKREAMFFDFSGMLVIGSVLSWLVPLISAWAFGSIAMP